ncbi:FxsB family cyclophane-forming radical SAM/SPASM peptide maturase [Longispora urticae]
MSEPAPDTVDRGPPVGWRPTPFGEFVLKVHQHCNLACDYCYVYTMADQSWRDRPAVMSEPVWTAAVHRVAEHAATHGLAEATVVLHGGEPLMAGTAHLVRLTDALRRAVPSSTRLGVSLQTNGVLLTEPILRALADAGVRVGVSLDGPGPDNDRHRRHLDGRGSAEEVRRAVGLLSTPRYRPLFTGLLCTIDLATDPVACYEALLESTPPAVDFLLPHTNWSAPPPPGARYGHWLARVFDRWYGAAHQETAVRFFEEIINLVLGGDSRSEQVGLSPANMVVIETDGAIEQVDSLKSAYPGAAATGLSVLTDPLDDALRHPGVIARQIGLAALCAECLACPVHQVCGAGHYAHRYRAGTGFRNPSAYCADLLFLIRHIQRRLGTDLAARSPGGTA